MKAVVASVITAAAVETVKAHVVDIIAVVAVVAHAIGFDVPFYMFVEM